MQPNTSALLLVAMVGLALVAQPTSAQTHFTACTSRTGQSASLLIPATIGPSLNGAPLETGDEIAIVTPDGRCAGVGVWKNQNLGIAIAGDDVMTSEKDGFAAGEALSFRIWDASTGTEYGEGDTVVRVTFASNRPYFQTDGRFRDRGIFSLSSLQAAAASPAPLAGTVSTGTEDAPASDASRGFSLAPNYPNPFNPSTTIQYTLQQGSDIQLEVFDLLGQRVRLLVSQHQGPGQYEVPVDLSELPSGLYLYRLQAGNQIEIRSMLLAK